jgi:hypothetical protein
VCPASRRLAPIAPESPATSLTNDETSDLIWQSDGGGLPQVDGPAMQHACTALGSTGAGEATVASPQMPQYALEHDHASEALPMYDVCLRPEARATDEQRTVLDTVALAPDARAMEVLPALSIARPG